MATASWSEEHSRAVAAAAPDVGAAREHELDVTWSRITPLLTDQRSRRRSRVRTLTGAGVAAIVLGAGGVAAGAVYSSHTGRGPIDAEDRRLGGPGERLDPAAPDYAQVVAHATRDVPFPTDQARDDFLTAEVADDKRGASPGTISVSTGAIRYWAARGAICAFADQWAGAIAAGDESLESQSASMLEEAPKWPAVTAVDPEQVIKFKDGRVTDPATGQTRLQSAVVNSTPAGYFPLVRDAAQAGDVAAMGAVLARWGACEPYGADMSNLPQANPPIG